MIVSGRYVLFMDPRRAYLGRGRSCFKASLDMMKKYARFILEYILLIIYIMC